MFLSIKRVRKLLDKVVLTLLEFGDVQSKTSDERPIKTFGLSIKLRVVDCTGVFPHPGNVQSDEENFRTAWAPLSGNRYSGMPYEMTQWLNSITTTCRADALNVCMALDRFE